MADKNYLITGITELLILSILDKHDSYVYEITKGVSEHSDGLLNIPQNTIYTATYKLETEGRISSYEQLVGKKRTRIYYHLEATGREYFKELMANYTDTITGVQNIFNYLNGNNFDTKENNINE